MLSYLSYSEVYMFKKILYSWCCLKASLVALSKVLNCNNIFSFFFTHLSLNVDRLSLERECGVLAWDSPVKVDSLVCAWSSKLVYTLSSDSLVSSRWLLSFVTSRKELNLVLVLVRKKINFVCWEFFFMCDWFLCFPFSFSTFYS